MTLSRSVLCLLVIFACSTCTAIGPRQKRSTWWKRTRDQEPNNSLWDISSKLLHRREKKDAPPTRRWHDLRATEPREPPTFISVHSPAKKSPPTKKTANSINPPTRIWHDLRNTAPREPPTRKSADPLTIRSHPPTERRDAAPPTLRKRQKGVHDKTSLAEQACEGGRLITCKKGTVTSLGYPDALPSNATCKWTIQAPEGQVIELDFTQIALGDGDCVTLSYRGSPMGSFYENALELCGQLPPRKVTSVGNEVEILLTTDGADGEGILFDFFVRDPVECEDLLEVQADAGTVSSVNFPQYYFPQAKCYWRIIASPDTVLSFTFNDLAIEHSRWCEYDAITLYDGPSTTDAKLGTYCGHEIPGVITSTSNVALVVLTSDSSSEDHGFELTWSAS